MFKRGWFLVLCVFIIAAIARAETLPPLTVEYSADRTVESAAGTSTGKIYASRDKERSETSMQGMESVTIVRRDKQLGWSLMPAQRMYRQIDLAQARKQSSSTPDDVQISAVGTESIEGHEATKYKLLMKDGSDGGFMWITPEGITVKMDMISKEGGDKRRMTVTLSNLQVGTQDPQLFELPADYTAMPGASG